MQSDRPIRDPGQPLNCSAGIALVVTATVAAADQIVRNAICAELCRQVATIASRGHDKCARRVWRHGPIACVGERVQTTVPLGYAVAEGHNTKRTRRWSRVRRGHQDGCAEHDGRVEQYTHNYFDTSAIPSSLIIPARTRKNVVDSPWRKRASGFDGRQRASARGQWVLGRAPMRSYARLLPKFLARRQPHALQILQQLL